MVEEVFNPVLCPITGHVYSSALDQFECWAIMEEFSFRRREDKQTYEVL